MQPIKIPMFLALKQTKETRVLIRKNHNQYNPVEIRIPNPY